MAEVSIVIVYIIIYLTGGWVHSVSFSPSGNKLAWVGHDSSISVVNMEGGQKYDLYL